jgi:hypothetical protein
VSCSRSALYFAVGGFAVPFILLYAIIYIRFSDYIQRGHQKPIFSAKHDPLEENDNGEGTQICPLAHVIEDFCHSGYKHNSL